MDTQCSNIEGTYADPDTLRIQERVRTRMIYLESNYGTGKPQQVPNSLAHGKDFCFSNTDLKLLTPLSSMAVLNITFKFNQVFFKMEICLAV